MIHMGGGELGLFSHYKASILLKETNNCVRTARQMAPTQKEGENTVRKYYKMVQYFRLRVTRTKTRE